MNLTSIILFSLAIIIILLGFLRPRKYCSKCGVPLPKFRKPKTVKRHSLFQYNILQTSLNSESILHYLILIYFSTYSYLVLYFLVVLALLSMCWWFVNSFHNWLRCCLRRLRCFDFQWNRHKNLTCIYFKIY